MKILSSQFYSNCRLTRGFNEIGTHSICVSTALRYRKPSYEGAYIGSGPFVEFILNRERGETWNEDDVYCGNTKLNEDLIVAVAKTI